MTKRALLYARVSGDDTGKDGRNLAGQLELCRNYALERGYEIVAELHEDDRGASGAIFELPQLNSVRDLARARAFDVLVVREIDRLSRKLAKQLIIEEELKRAGVQIEYVLTAYDDTPEGRLNKHIKATIAEYEREKIGERTTRARRMQARDGSVMTHGHRIYGYNMAMVGSRHALEVNEAEAQHVRQVFDWYTKGDEAGKLLSIREITARLSDLHIATVADLDGKYHKLRERGEWASASVARMLSNETYAGVWRYGRSSAEYNVIEVSVPAIIDLPTYQEAQARRAENRDVRRRAPKYDYLMAGRLRCSCGYAIAPKACRDTKTRLYYDCAARTRDARVRVRQCEASVKHVEQVDAVVWQWVKSLLVDREALTMGLQEYQAQRERENSPFRERLVTIDDLLVETRAQLTKLLDLYLTGDFPRDLLVERKGRLQETIIKLEAERDRIQAYVEANAMTEGQIRDLQDFVTEAGKGMARADAVFAERRRIIDLLEVTGVFGVEDGRDVVDVTCVLTIGDQRLRLLSNDS